MIDAVLSGESRWCIIRGENEEILPTLPDGAVAHVVMDPPYSEHVHGKSCAGKRKTPLADGNGRISRCAFMREAEFGFDPITLSQMEAVSDECSRLAQRWTLAFCDVESVHLWRGSLESAGLVYKRCCSWEKIGGTPQFSGDRPGVGFEAIVCAHRKGRSRWNGGGKLGVYHHITCIERGGKSTENDTRVHPTQKPLPLMLELLQDFTDPDDVILDPYCGSGTTIAAAIRLGRRAIGIERSPKWAAIARERCEAEADGSSLRAKQAGQLPLFQVAS